jgi:hypothetical protein
MDVAELKGVDSSSGAREKKKGEPKIEGTSYDIDENKPCAK